MAKEKHELSLPDPITLEDPSYASIGIKHWFSAQHSLGLKGHSKRNVSVSRRTEDQGTVIEKIMLAREGQEPQVVDEQLSNWLEEMATKGHFMTQEHTEELAGAGKWFASEGTDPEEYPESASGYAEDLNFEARQVISIEDLADGITIKTLEDLMEEEPVLFERDSKLFHENTDDAFEAEVTTDPEDDPFVHAQLLREGGNLDPLKWEPRGPAPECLVGTNGYSDQSKSILEEDYSQESRP